MNRDVFITNRKSIIILSIVVFLILPTISYAQDFSGRIDNGTPVEDPQLYPWMAALMEADDSNPDLGERQFCGGALIDPYWVLTAGHCVTISQYAENSGGIIVRLGTTNLADFTEQREVDYFVIHEPTDPSVDPFDPTSLIWYYGNDLALLHLSYPSNQPILSLGDSYIDDLLCISMGWGGDDAYPDEQLLQGDFFIDNLLCDVEGLPNYLPYLSDEHHFYNCVEEELLSDSSIHLISGDSGGPLIYLDNEEIWRIAGVASWMAAFESDEIRTNTNVFTRVDNKTDWINNVISNVPDEINITFANRDIEGSNLTGTLGVFSVHPEFNSGETIIIPSGVYVNIRTFNEIFNDNSLKHHNWNDNYGDYLMNHDRHFTIGDEFDIARFLNVYDVAISTNIPTDPVLDFLTIHDPWYRDPVTEVQPDSYRLLSDVAPSGIYKVFLNQAPDEFHPDGQIYKFGASPLYEVSNLCSDFDHWSGNYVTIENPTNLTTTVIFTDQGAALTANYNGHGDMDEDGAGSVLDLVILVNIILEYTIPTDYQIWAGDLNGDDLIDVSDAVILNDNIINGCTPLSREIVDTGTVRLKFSQIEGLARSEGMDLTLTVDSDVAVSGVQLEFGYDSSLYEFAGLELTEVSSEFELDFRDFENGITRVVIYPQEDIEIPAGVHDILVVHYSGLGKIIHESQISITNPIIVGHRGIKLNVVKQGNDLPSSFRLHPAYPNPFNPETTIRFDMNEPAEIEMKVFDINGREVETLVNSYLNTGNYDITWDAAKYPSGIYFIKMNSSTHSVTEKVILLK